MQALVLENVDDVDVPGASPSGGVSHSMPKATSQQPDGVSGHSGGVNFRTDFASELPLYEADDPQFYGRVYDTMVADEQQFNQQQLVQQELQQRAGVYVKSEAGAGDFVSDQIEASLRSDLFDPRANDQRFSPRITRSMIEGVQAAEIPAGEWKREMDIETGAEYDVYRSNADGSVLDSRAVDYQGEEKAEYDSPQRGAPERRLPLYRAPLGTRVRIENTRFDKPNQPGSFSNSTPSKYSYGEIVGRSQNGVIQQVRYDGDKDPVRSDWRHLAYEDAESSQIEGTSADAGYASVGKADAGDATAQQDAIHIEEQPQSQATDLPANRPTATYHDSTMRIAQITPTGTTPLSLPTNTFIAASTPPTSQHDPGFFHWYQHHRKRRKLAALGQRARVELNDAAAHDRYSAIRRRQLATGLPPQHHLKPRDRHGPAKFHHRAVKK